MSTRIEMKYDETRRIVEVPGSGIITVRESESI
jgi:hypothetical protein